MTKKKGFVHVRLDEDLTDYVANVLKGKPGGISRFINDAIRTEMKKADVIGLAKQFKNKE